MSALDEENRDPLEILADDFLQRQRSGEYPSISEYVAQHPDLAADIEELFPTIVAMEQLKAHREGSNSGWASLGGVRLERLGDFRLVGEIGRGGMGIVFEAFQESLGRPVAVKVLPRQALLDPKQLQRFQREAQTAARLHHTNIVPLFGVGEQDGYHYIVMQLIRGVSLDAVLGKLRQLRSEDAALSGRDAKTPAPGTESTSEAVRLARVLAEGQFWQEGEAKGDDSKGSGVFSHGGDQAPSCETAVPAAMEEDSRPLGAAQPPRFGPAYWRSIAAIGMQAADALHYAHTHHTLHRDVKPANLLLDSQGVVWITDFGLAKALDQEHASQTAALAGTLRYMAPEQFSGHVDARSDVYSLGLTLYELITLQPAFTDASRSRLIRKITQDQPAAPRQINPAIPRDLETIVLKAIAHEPAHRYASAAELAGDLQRFLEDRPIAARRVSAVERLWRWSRRNPAVAGLAASTLVLLVLVAIVTSVGYARTAKERQRAEATSALALEALDNIFRQFAPERTAPHSGLLVMDEADEEITVPGEAVLSKETAVLLEHMLAFYDRLAEQGGGDTRLRRKVAEANRRVGDIRQRLGHTEEAQAAYKRAIKLYTDLAQASGEDADLRTEIARVQNELGNLYLAMNDWRASRAWHSSALATLQAIPAADSASPQYQYELARTYYFLGKRPFGQPALYPLAPGGHRSSRPLFPFPLPRPKGRHRDWQREHEFAQREKERQENLQKAIEILQRLVSEYPSAPDYRHLLARCYREDQPPFFHRGPKSPSSRVAQAAEILEKLVAEYPDVPDYRQDLIRTYASMTAAWPFARRPDEDAAIQRSREVLEKAMTLSEELVAEHPNIPDYAAFQVFLRMRLADLFWESDPSRAEANMRKALDQQSALARRFPQNSFYKLGLGWIEESLAVFLRDRGELPKARSLFEARIALLKDALQKSPHLWRLWGALAGSYGNLADVLGQLNDEQGAAQAARQAQEAARQAQEAARQAQEMVPKRRNGDLAR